MKNPNQYTRLIYICVSFMMLSLTLPSKAFFDAGDQSVCQRSLQNYPEVIASQLKNQYPSAWILDVSTPSVTDWNYYPCSSQDTSLSCGTESWELSVKAHIPEYSSEIQIYEVFLELNILQGTCSEIDIEIQL